jgi:hypothetical protein
VPQGSGKSSSGRPSGKKKSLLDGARDWKFLVDFDDQMITFPPEIYATPERPDIVIWSVSSRTVILLELTCPAEEGIQAASLRKTARYTPLKNYIKESGWSPYLMTFEVGARGFVARSTRRCFRRLGLTNKEVSNLSKTLSTVVSRCSYAIYLTRETVFWDQSRVLLTPPPKLGDRTQPKVANH